MAEPLQRPVIAQAPISLILAAGAVSAESQDALRAWRLHLQSLRRPFEIFLLQEARSEGRDETVPMDAVQPCRAFTYDRALGHRDALNAAIRAARNPLLVFCSCDQQFDPNELDRMLKVIDQVDLVVGYRVGRAVPFWRLFLDMLAVIFSRVVIGVSLAPTACWLGSAGWGRRWIARWIFGLRVNDPECPFRLARREIFQRIPLQSQGSFVQIEMLAKANHLTCLIAEEPVTWTPAALSATEDTFSNDAWRVFRTPDFTSVQRSG